MAFRMLNADFAEAPIKAGYNDRLTVDSEESAQEVLTDLCFKGQITACTRKELYEAVETTRCVIQRQR